MDTINNSSSKSINLLWRSHGTTVVRWDRSLFKSGEKYANVGRQFHWHLSARRRFSYQKNVHVPPYSGNLAAPLSTDGQIMIFTVENISMLLLTGISKTKQKMNVIFS